MKGTEKKKKKGKRDKTIKQITQKKKMNTTKYYTKET